MKKQSLQVLSILLIMAVAVFQYVQQPDSIATSSNLVETKLSVQTRQHILYGDASGGGHLHGMNAPCKSEFPADWDAHEIENTVVQIAANDNLPWKQQKNGYWVSESMQQGVRVRVVISADRNRIITAYPVNVKRNPCPEKRVPANDN